PGPVLLLSAPHPADPPPGDRGLADPARRRQPLAVREPSDGELAGARRVRLEPPAAVRRLAPRDRAPVLPLSLVRGPEVPRLEPMAGLPVSGAVVLRKVEVEDLPTLFEHQFDPEANRMADFPARDREAFMAHWAKILADPSATVRTVLLDGVIV